LADVDADLPDVGAGLADEPDCRAAAGLPDPAGLVADPAGLVADAARLNGKSRVTIKHASPPEPSAVATASKSGSTKASSP